MTARKINEGARQAEIVLRDLAKHPGSNAAQVAERIKAASSRAILNRLVAMRVFGLVVETGHQSGIQYAIAGELKAMLKKNREDAAERVKSYHAKVNAATAARAKERKAEREALAAKQFEQGVIKPSRFIELASGGKVEPTATGRVFHLSESCRKLANDCIGSRAPRSTMGCGAFLASQGI